MLCCCCFTRVGCMCAGGRTAGAVLYLNHGGCILSFANRAVVGDRGQAQVAMPNGLDALARGSVASHIDDNDHLIKLNWAV